MGRLKAPTFHEGRKKVKSINPGEANNFERFKKQTQIFAGQTRDYLVIQVSFPHQFLPTISFTEL